MAGESPTQLHRRTTSSQFTTTTYPGGNNRQALQRRNPSQFFRSLLHRRRHVAALILGLFVVILLLRSLTSTALHNLTSIPTWSGLGHTHQKNESELTWEAASGTETIRAPTATNSALPETQMEVVAAQTLASPVVFVLITWSQSSAIEGALLIKSILMYNTNPTEFHIVCDDEAEAYLRGRFALVRRPRYNVSVKFYKPTWQSMLDRVEREGSIKTDHSAGLPGLMKLFLHEIVPITKGIYVDTDAFFISDPTLLWNIFETFEPSTSIVMSSHPDQNAPEWNHASRICSCVMLLHLERLRNQRLMDSTIYQGDTSNRFPSALSPEAFRAMYGLPGGDGRGRYENVRLGDQGYWWAIVKHRPDIFQPLSFDFEVTSCLFNTYNIGLGEDDIEESIELSRQNFLNGTPQEGTVILPKLLHFNCLHGTDVYMDWEGWANPEDILTQRWGAALEYHKGYKWIWLNNGGGTVVLETTSVVFADEQLAKEMSL